MEEVLNKVNSIKTKEDFVEFVDLLLKDLKFGQQKWENQNLETYLEALGRWTEDMDGYYQNMNLEMPKNVDWKVFANILAAARIYE